LASWQIRSRNSSLIEGRPWRRRPAKLAHFLSDQLAVPADHGLRLDHSVGQEGFSSRRAAAASTRRSACRQRTNLHLAFEDADLVTQQQQLGLIGGAVAEGCEWRGR